MCDGKIAEKLRSRLQKLEVERAELLTALRVLEQYATGDEGEVTDIADVAADGGDVVTTPATAKPSGPAAYPGVEIDFTGAANLLERVMRIAEAVDGPLDAMEMARYLVDRRVSKADPHNLRSHIINAISGHAEFVKVAPGKYRYVPEPQTPEEPLTPGTSE